MEDSEYCESLRSLKGLFYKYYQSSIIILDEVNCLLNSQSRIMLLNKVLDFLSVINIVNAIL